MRTTTRTAVAVDPLPGRGIRRFVGRDSALPSEEMTVGTARYADEFGPMEPHHHAEETVYVLSADRAWVRWGSSPGSLNERVDLETFAGAASFMDEVLDRCRAERRVTTMLGRRRAIEGVRDRDGRRGAGGVFALSLPERTAVNTVVQGSAADLIKLAMLRVADRLKAEQRAAALVLQIHDELLLETPQAELAAVEQLVVGEMQQAMELTVPLEVSVHSGCNWAECEK